MCLVCEAAATPRRSPSCDPSSLTLPALPLLGRERQPLPGCPASPLQEHLCGHPSSSTACPADLLLESTNSRIAIVEKAWEEARAKAEVRGHCARC